jgi:hypothetical protein
LPVDTATGEIERITRQSDHATIEELLYGAAELVSVETTAFNGTLGFEVVYMAI